LSVSKFLTPEQFEQVHSIATKTARKPWLPFALRILWATGCRASEIMGCEARPRDGQKAHHGLRGGDILPHSKLFIEGKSTRSKKLKPRTVLVADSSVYEELVAISRMNSGKIFAGDADTLSDSILRLKRHLPLELRWFHAHSLRHSHAIHALRGGIDLMSLQRQLGHEDVLTTAKYLRYAPMDEAKYLKAFTGQLVPNWHERSCPSCGFGWREGPKGELDLNDRIGIALRRR
jgi:integrase